MIQLIQCILKLVAKGDTDKNHPACGLISHVLVDVNTYVTSARIYVTSAKMSMLVHGWDEHEGSLTIINYTNDM